MLPTSTSHLSTRRQVLRAGYRGRSRVVGRGRTAQLGPGGRCAAPVSPSTRISMVGDSLTLGTLPFQADDLAGAGWSHSAIDAYVSRGIRTKLPVRSAHRHHCGRRHPRQVGRHRRLDRRTRHQRCGDLSHDKQSDVIRQMMDHIGYGHKVMWVNVYLPDGRRCNWRGTPHSPPRADERDGEMFVYDWAIVRRREPAMLAHDHIHYSRDGYRFRSTAIGLASRATCCRHSDSAPSPSGCRHRSRCPR